MKNIGVDLDGCVYDFGSKFLAMLNLRLGTNYGYYDQTHWFYEESLGIDKKITEEVFKCFVDNKMYQSLDIYPYAQEGLCLLESQGYHIHYITSRPHEGIRPTLKKILSDGLPMTGIYFCNTDEEKIKYSKNNDISLVIEDKPSIIDLYMKNGIKVIKIEHPYNKETKATKLIDGSPLKPEHWKNVPIVVEKIFRG